MSEAMTTMNIREPFTQSWIQALTLAAENPVARNVKPALDLVDRVSKNLPDIDRRAAGRDLWAFASKERMTDFLWLLPTLQTNWLFDEDDIFAYTRRESPANIRDEAAWLAALGVDPVAVPLSAEVTSGDWAGFVRKEAVRLQKSHSLAANQGGSTLHLPCQASWDGKRWQVQFDQVDWVVRPYDDIPVIGRPTVDVLQDQILLTLAEADAHIRVNAGTASIKPEYNQPWLAANQKLHALHSSLIHQSSDYSDWLLRIWLCAWPVVYREQSLLQGKADLGHIRQEMKACLNAQPRLTIWMMVFAKLICQVAVGRGLGFCADFRDL
jgi:hypothetical protein